MERALREDRGGAQGDTATSRGWLRPQAGDGCGLKWGMAAATSGDGCGRGGWTGGGVLAKSPWRAVALGHAAGFQAPAGVVVLLWGPASMGLGSSLWYSRWRRAFGLAWGWGGSGASALSSESVRTAGTVRWHHWSLFGARALSLVPPSGKLRPCGPCVPCVPCTVRLRRQAARMVGALDSLIPGKNTCVADLSTPSTQDTSLLTFCRVGGAGQWMW